MREEEKRGLVYIIVWLVGWFCWFFYKKKFNCFFAKFSLLLKFWRKTWKHLFISVFYEKKKTMEKVFFYLV